MRLTPLFALVPSLALAAPVSVAHSGYLLAADDHPLTSTGLSLRFQVFPSASLGTASFDATCAVDVQAGYYAVTLGAGCGAPIDSATLPPSQPAWLEVTVGTTALLPRLALSAAPSALVAADALKLNGVAGSSLVDAGTGKILASALPLGTSASNVAAGNDARLVNALQAGATAGGDLGGTYPNPAVTQLRGQPVSATAPTTAGQILTWDGSTWAAAAPPTAIDATKLPLAGGTMSGAISMGGSAITNLADPATATGAATKGYADANLGGRAISAAAPAVNDVLGWTGAQWAPTTPSASSAANVSQAELWGTIQWAGTAGCQWATTSTSYANFAPLAACNTPTVTGKITAPSTKVPAFNAALDPGNYLVVLGAHIGSSDVQVGNCRISNGTITSDDQNIVAASSGGQLDFTVNGFNAGFTVPTAQAAADWHVQCRLLPGGTGSVWIVNAQATRPVNMKIYRFPLASQLAAVANTTPLTWSGYVTGCASSPTAAGAAFTDFTLPSGCSVTTRQSTNFPVVSLGTSGASITFTPAKTGTYLVTGSVTYTTSGGNSVSFALTDGANNVIAQNTAWPASGTMAMSLTGLVEVPSLAPMTLKLRGATPTGTATIQPQTLRFNDWNIIDVSQPFAAPVITGQVVAPSSASVRIAAGSVNLNGTSHTLVAQVGSWLAGPVRSSVGLGTIAVTAGTFSATPICTASATGGSYSVNVWATSPTSISYDLRASSTGTAIENNETINFTCTGTH